MISASAVKLCCVDDFWVGSDSVFINDFWVSCKPYALTILVSAVKLCCVDDFWVGSDSVFINDFWVHCKPYALTILASAVKLCCVDSFRQRFLSLVNYMRWRFQRQLWNCVALMISKSAATQFFINDFWVSRKPYALMISASVVKLCYIDDFWVGNDSFFVNNF
jgi:hypothetical protein